MQKRDDRRAAFSDLLGRYLDAEGKVTVLDPEVVEDDRRKGQPRSEKEAAERYRLMQAAQIIRCYERIYGT